MGAPAQVGAPFSCKRLKRPSKSCFLPELQDFKSKIW